MAPSATPSWSDSVSSRVAGGGRATASHSREPAPCY